MLVDLKFFFFLIISFLWKVFHHLTKENIKISSFHLGQKSQLCLCGEWPALHRMLTKSERAADTKKMGYFGAVSPSLPLFSMQLWKILILRSHQDGFRAVVTWWPSLRPQAAPFAPKPGIPLSCCQLDYNSCKSLQLFRLGT